MRNAVYSAAEKLRAEVPSSVDLLSILLGGSRDNPEMYVSVGCLTINVNLIILTHVVYLDLGGYFL